MTGEGGSRQDLKGSSLGITEVQWHLRGGSEENIKSQLK